MPHHIQEEPMSQPPSFEIVITPHEDPYTGFDATLFQVLDEDGRTGDAILTGTGASPLQATADLVSEATEGWRNELLRPFIDIPGS